MQTITAVVPARNEGKNIARCIETLRWCNRIIVMWMGDDKTGEIAKKLGVELIAKNTTKRDNFIAVQKNINWVIDHSSTDWILRVDADEVVTPELQKEILAVLTPSYIKVVAYGIPRAQFFLGGFLKGGDWAYDRLVRLFRPAYCRYEPVVPVHEQFKVNGQIGYLKNKLLHYSHPTFKEATRKFQLYTDIEAKYLNMPKLQALWNLFFQPPYVFLRWIIWHRGYIDGVRGIVAAAMRGWYEYLLYSKYLFKER